MTMVVEQLPMVFFIQFTYSITTVDLLRSAKKSESANSSAETGADVPFTTRNGAPQGTKRNKFQQLDRLANRLKICKECNNIIDLLLHIPHIIFFIY